MSCLLGQHCPWSMLAASVDQCLRPPGSCPSQVSVIGMFFRRAGFGGDGGDGVCCISVCWAFFCQRGCRVYYHPLSFFGQRGCLL